jgi:chemotaxis protein MotB
MHQEIIIVRRSGGDDAGGHHGGAWKIAYADFVTAMMAFFLVMWLINSANEVTKSRVASYFNPIKMTDATPVDRGVRSSVEKKALPAETEKTELAGGVTDLQPRKDEKASSSSDQHVLQEPFEAMQKILTEKTGGVTPVQGEPIPWSVGDPFDPQAWHALQSDKTEHGKLTENSLGEPGGPSHDTVNRSPEASAHLKKPLVQRTEALETWSDTVTPNVSKTVALERAVKAIIDRHKTEVDVTVGVRETKEGLLIVLGDNSGKGMFEIGAATPNAALIDIVGVIGKLLAEQPGDLIIRGHTDSRKYRSNRFDNWQLSTARAHMASYMLMRGGFDEARIKRIEGHGAAQPISDTDPAADVNRRVEFLLSNAEKSHAP